MRIVHVWLLLSSMLWSALSSAEESQHFVVSTALFSHDDIYRAFYNSRIFVGQEKPDFIITNTSVTVFSFKDTYFFSDDGRLSEAEILAWTNHKESRLKKGLIGHSYIGFSFDGSLSDSVVRGLGAPAAEMRFSEHKNDKKSIYAITLSTQLAWPKNASDLKEVPGVSIQDKSGGKAVMIARPVGASSAKLALVDELIARKKGALYLELGLNESDEPTKLNEALIAEVAQRKPLVFPGASDLVAIKDHSSKYAALKVVSPFGQALQSLPASNVKRSINFWSLTNNEDFWVFYQQKAFGTAETIKSGLERMVALEKNPQRSLNIVRVFSEKAALEAAKSVYVDLVLYVLPEGYAQLPTSEVIDLKNAVMDSFEAVAPIVFLSPLEVSEITISGATLGAINQLRVNRHALKDHNASAAELGEKSFNRRKQVALPALAKNWERAELNSILGGLMMKDTKADVALFENDYAVTPVNGPLSHDYLLSRLNRPGRMAILETNGRQLKKIMGLINDKKLSSHYAVVGIDPKARLIGQRALHDNEKIRIALTNKALLDIYKLSSRGALDQELAIRAPFIESIYGRLDNLLFLNSSKNMVNLADKKSVEQTLDRTLMLPSFAEIMDRSLPELSEKDWQVYVENPYGTARHSLIFDIEYLDFGFSKNVANDMYKYHQQPDTPNLPMSRGTADTFAHLLIFSKMSLTYDAPGLITTLTNGIRFLTVTGFDKKPSKDKITFGLDFRLPWERSFFKDKAIVVAPIFKNLYETKMAPIAFLSGNSVDDWKELKMSPRPKKLDSLLGLNINFTNLGFNVDVGGVMSTDFNQKNVRDAIAVGPGLNFASKWSLLGPLELSSVIQSSYLFALPHSQAENKAALGIEGTAWLRVARFYDFSLSLMSDFLFTTLQEKPKNMAISSIFGFTISYGRLMRIFG